MARAFSSSDGDLRVLVGIVVVHADHVVFQERAAVGKARLIVEIVVARVHVAEDGVPEIGAFLLDDIEHLVRQPLPARQMDRQRHAGDARARARRRAATCAPRR